MFPILTDFIKMTHRTDKYFVDYKIEIDQIPMVALYQTCTNGSLVVKNLKALLTV